MSRRAKGTVEWRSDAWHARVTMLDGTRPWIRMPGIPRADRAHAERVAAVIADRARSTGAVPAMREETVTEWFARWRRVREAEGISDAGKHAAQFAKWVEPVIGTMPIRSVTRADLKAVVAHLDKQVKDGTIRWKTATNVWAFVSRAFKDACESKATEVCVLTTNPASGVRPPEKGTRTGKQYLYPSEFLRLVSCEDVPLWRRRVYAVAVYTYMRAGELDALDWSDVDLEHRLIRVHRSRDRGKPKKSAVLSSTKTDRERRVTIEPNLLPLLEAMAAESGRKGKLLRMPPGGGSDGESPLLREDLVRAGVRREALHAARSTTKRITFHDLRATGMTWAAMRGDDMVRLMSRSGHVTYQTALAYVREAEILRDAGAFGEVFPALPEGLVNRPAIVQSSVDDAGNMHKLASPRGFEPRDQ